jgi:multimeric flavodoxin WrbA
VTPRRLLLVWHSRGGRTAQLKDAVLAGVAREPGISCRVLHAAEAGPDDWLWADGFLFGCAEHFGAMAGLFKDFLERSYYPVQGQVDGRPYGLFIACQNDGRGAVSGIEKVLRGLNLRLVQPALVWRENEPGYDWRAAAEELGEALASGLALSVW